MRLLIFILIIAAGLGCATMWTHQSGGVPKPPIVPGAAAQQAWSVAEWIAAAMLTGGILLGTLDALNGTGVKGPIALLAGGAALLTMALTFSRFQKELELFGAALFIACIAFAGWEIWQHWKQIRAQI